MASQGELEKLVGHAAFDGAFRNWLFNDPEAAAKSVGIALTPMQASYIKRLGPTAGDQLAKCIEPIIPRVDPSWGG